MEVKTNYTLEISKTECTVLVKLLGKLSDTDMMERGLSTNEIGVIHEAWGCLPSWDDEQGER